ncbi:MAG: GHKL domain-containing protein [Nitrospirae bacterium]|nr:GHKL domain-containing protein [Nitrospirota bacterium]
MSLQKKIMLSFLISSAIIAILAISAFITFVEIRKEIRYLELSDTLRSKTLQLRRHEKNFFLYGDAKEIKSVYSYIEEIGKIIQQNQGVYDTDKLINLRYKMGEYKETFSRIDALTREFHEEIGQFRNRSGGDSLYFPIMETTFLESPLVNADLLKNLFSLKANAPVIITLNSLNREIISLRRDGEEILTLSKNLDSSAREKVEKAIGFSQKAALILFPLFLLVGVSALFFVSRSAVNHLRILTGAIEKTGKGDFSSLTIPHERDEVGVLIDAFNKMENDLIERDREIHKKNEELLHSKKLASIGTLASGVAHELNNPLNNIYLSAQVLSKEISSQEACSEMVKETVSDIFSQTLRVKRIVSDLLEFSREKPPELVQMNLSEVINTVLHQMISAGEMAGISPGIKAAETVSISADRHLMEQVFINLFSNAVQAMEGKGDLTVDLAETSDAVIIRISDTGKGIAAGNIQRIFDPFYTSKEKGTGLGLAIVHNIIEKHRGKISVKSEPGKGTEFTITLPR